MGAGVAWFTAIVLVLSVVLVLHQIGFDVTPMVGTAVHGLERFLGTPL